MDVIREVAMSLVVIYVVLVKLNPALCARLVIHSVVRPQSRAGVTTPFELYYLVFTAKASSMPSRWDVQVAHQCNVQAQGTPQSAPHHTVVPITDESTKGLSSFRGTTYRAVVDRSCSQAC